MNDSLSMWTVYDHPKDFPNTFVAREFRIGPGGKMEITANVIISADIDVLRRTLLTDMGLTCLDRNEEDDPAIVETWL